MARSITSIGRILYRIFRHWRRLHVIPVSLTLFLSFPLPSQPATDEVISFTSGRLILQVLLYRPAGPEPFPAVIYNHGSEGNAKQ